MTKIKNTEAYPLKIPVATDTIVGSDSENDGKTVSFQFDSFVDFVNSINGNEVISYTFATSPVPDLDENGYGYFLSENNITNPINVISLNISKKTKSSFDLTQLYQFIKTNSNDFVLNIRNTADPNNFVYFEISDVQEEDFQFVFTVSTTLDKCLGALINKAIYSLSFLTAAGGNQDLQETMENGSIATGISTPIYIQSTENIEIDSEKDAKLSGKNNVTLSTLGSNLNINDSVGYIYSSAGEDGFILKNNDYFSLQVKNPSDSSIVKLLMEKLNNGNNLQFRLPTDKPAGTYTLATLYIKSNESLDKAHRKGDVIYGILDQYTGEEITLSKIDYIPIVDNIIYFQLGTEYFKRNNIDKYNVKWFGAKGDGVTDDTEKIQSCINKVFELGGGVIYFPISIYIVSGPLKNNVGDLSINYNSQIYIPTEGVDFANRKSIKLLGEISPNLNQSGGIGNAISPNTGVIIRSTIQGSGVLPSVIAGKGGGFFLNFSYTSFFCENIAVQLTPNSNNKITMGGFNFKDVAIANFEYVAVYPYNLNLVNSGRPDVIDVCGIHMPVVNNEHICTLNKVTVGGFTNGYILGEHTSAYDAIAVCCVNAFNHGANFHIGNYNKISSFWCENDFVVSGASRFIVNLQTENIYKGKWYDNKSTINDLSNLGRGTIHYNLVKEGVGVDNSLFIKKGGYFIKSKVIGVNPVNAITGTTATLKVGDGDLDLLITTSNSPVNITVPDITSYNFDVGTTIKIAQYGDGKITLSPGTGVVLNSAYSLSSRKKYSVIYVTKQYDNDWVVYGDLQDI